MNKDIQGCSDSVVLRENTIKLLFNSDKLKNKSLLIIEGKSDFKIYRSLFDDKNVYLYKNGSCDGLIPLLEHLNLEYMDCCLAIKDADFDNLEGKKYPQLQNLFLTDFHDIEMMMIDDDAENKICSEFLDKKEALANYFDEGQTQNIFDYIPPQKTNQIFTPRWVVKKMVDLLEKENPECFADPNHTFADLYMKSGMYIAEIVTRLYQNKQMKELFPDNAERLNHIFAKQVYGCAPTEIIYRICLRYLLGFSDKVHINTHHIELCDTLVYAKNITFI